MAKKTVKKRARKTAVGSKATDAVAVSASTQIDRRISDLHASNQPWRDEVLARVRKIILKASPGIDVRLEAGGREARRCDRVARRAGGEDVIPLGRSGHGLHGFHGAVK